MHCSTCNGTIDNPNCLTYIIPKWKYTKDPIKINFCSQNCFNKCIYRTYCSFCRNELDEKSIEPIEMKVPGGIKGHGPARTVYLCNLVCKDEYFRTGLCQICKCCYDYEMIDNHRVCTDDFDIIYGYHPTCKEIYTGNYKCNLCNEVQNVKNNKCIIVQHNDGEYNYCCFNCLENKNIILYTFYEKWNKVYEHMKEYESITKLLNT